MQSPDQAQGPIVLRLQRMKSSPQALLVDKDLDVHGFDEIGNWIAAGADVTVIDSDTGDDITRILFARWQDGRVVDPIGERR